MQNLFDVGNLQVPIEFASEDTETTTVLFLYAFVSLGLRSDVQPLDDDVWDLSQSVPDFEEVPFEILDAEYWSILIASPYLIKQNIPILEARALLFSVRHACATQPVGRVLFLVDNLALVLAVSKGRSHNYLLLPIIRKIYAAAFRSGHI